MFKFLAAIITPWIDIIGKHLSPGDCVLLMMDSTTAEGWMQKSNFSKPNNDPIQATTHVNTAQKFAPILLKADMKGYSQ